MLISPIIAVFLVSLIAYSHDRIRFVAEPFMVLIASYALLEICVRLRGGRKLVQDECKPAGESARTP